MKPKIKAIYAISCNAGGKSRVYIGSSTDLYERMKNHFRSLKRGNHRCKHLQNAYNKYGVESLSIDVLGKYDDVTPEQLRVIERMFIDSFLAVSERWELMNSTLNTLSPLDDPEVKRRQKEAASKYFKDNPEFAKATAERGRERFAKMLEDPKHIERLRNRISEFRTNPEINAKRISRLRDVTGKPVRCLETGEVFASSELAAKWVRDSGKPKASQSAIGLCCRGGLKTAYKLHWEFAQPLDNHQNP